MPTHPLTGARLGQNSDSPLGGQYLAEVVNELSPLTIPSFPNAAARDAAFSAWVTAGNSMRDGLHCTVAGVDLVYRGGQWRGIGYFPVLTGTVGGPYSVAVSDSDPRPVGFINVPDFGVPYRLRTYGGVEAIGVNARPDMVFDISGVRWGFAAGLTQYMTSADVSPVFTGPQLLRMFVYRGTGTGSWTSTSSNFRMTAEIIPA